VRLQLRRHLLARLSSCRPEHQVPDAERVFTLSPAERVHCLQRLCFLYPESEVLSHYQVGSVSGGGVKRCCHDNMMSTHTQSLSHTFNTLCVKVIISKISL